MLDTATAEPWNSAASGFNCVASPAGQAYWSGGTTIGSALIFGYVGGLNAAKRAERGA